MSVKKITRQIILKYNPSKSICLPNVNKYVSCNGLVNVNNLEISCLLTGYKKIYITNSTKALNNIDPILISLIKIQKIVKKIKKISYFIYYLACVENINGKIIMRPCFIKEKRTILYTNAGLKNALFIELRDSELNLREFQEPGTQVEFDNPCLNGRLLNYKKSDIKFFYQVNYFRQNLVSKADIEITDKYQFSDWPEKIKVKFYDFIKKNWLRSNACKLYKTEKLEAENIINLYKKMPVKTIKELIKSNLSKIKILEKDYYKKGLPI